MNISTGILQHPTRQYAYHPPTILLLGRRHDVAREMWRRCLQRTARSQYRVAKGKDRSSKEVQKCSGADPAQRPRRPTNQARKRSGRPSRCVSPKRIGYTWRAPLPKPRIRVTHTPTEHCPRTRPSGCTPSVIICPTGALRTDEACSTACSRRRGR